MNSPVEKIKERLSIVDVISSYIPVIQAGKNYKAKCPFHNEKTPSFFISPERGSYYCFGCGAKGDIFSFVEHFEGTDFLGSLKILADRAGVVIDTKYKKSEHSREEHLYEIMEEATNFFEAKFDNQPEARSYLRDRGLSDATIKSFRIGYAPSTWRSVSDHLINKGFKKEDIETVGLIKKSENGFYDRFRGRIIFPISDSSGRIIAFSGRIFALSNDVSKKESSIEEAKYLNSPDTPLFNKSKVLYGIDKAKLSIRSRGYSIVVEGQMDLILSHQALFTNTVAVSGTALADNVNDTNESKINNLGLIRRLSSNVIFAFDGDEAGIRAASRSAVIALSLDMQVKIAVLPTGQDPADIIKKNPDSWKEIIKNSVNIVSFHIDKICNSTSDTRIRGKKIREIVFPFLSMIKSSIERSAYITEINNKTGISEKAIIEDFEIYERTAKIDSKEAVFENENSPNKQSRRELLEKRLFGIIFWNNDNKQIKEVDEFCNSFKENIGVQTFDKMLHSYEPFSDTLAIEAEMWYGSNTDELSRDIKEIVLNLEEEILNENKASLQPLDTKEKLTQFNNILKRIEEIKKSRSY
ncbi:MAG: DNA primase [Patescibacteria group bacterium]|nr:DNA primase [Patescibacteria group bacterium]